ncbi:hypothetical protein P7K49_013302, partial [Saguinus oedipus]
ELDEDLSFLYGAASVAVAFRLSVPGNENMSDAGTTAKQKREVILENAARILRSVSLLKITQN